MQQYGTIQEFLQWKEQLCQGLLFYVENGLYKNTDGHPCQSVLRVSQNQAPTLSIQEGPAAALNLSSGNAGSCWVGWYPCFCLMVMLFGICRIRSDFLGPREIGEGNQEPVYRNSWFSYLPKLHSGRNIRDIHDRQE